MLEFAGGRPAAELAGSRIGGVAWSPDGGWLALAASGEIEIFGESRSEPAYVLPIRVGAVGWTVTPETPP